MPRILNLYEFETSETDLIKAFNHMLETSRQKVSAIVNCSSASRSFENTIAALDDLNFFEGLVMHRIHLLHHVSPLESIRNCTQELIEKYTDWDLEKSYHPGLYAAANEVANVKLELQGEKKRLLEETLKDYRRRGLHLKPEVQTEMKTLLKELSKIETEFGRNINDHEDEIQVHASDLAGLDEATYSSFPKTKDGLIRVTLQYPHYLPVMEFAHSEDIRKALITKKYRTAIDKNPTLLDQMIRLRERIAKLLHYESWNAYVLDDRMAKSPHAVSAFLKDLEKRLRPKAERELLDLRNLKRELTGNKNAEVHIWDYAYLMSSYKKKTFQVDTQALRSYFPLARVLEGLYSILGELFQIDFIEEKNVKAWAQEVRLFRVFDRKTKEVLGAFYLDLFPRPGKFGHAAAFTLIEGKALKSGAYQAPLSALVCNFSHEAPHFLSHSEVETLFHEFGHVLHNILTEAEFSAFSGSSVAMDFVEAPSQVLENWVWDISTLNRIAKTPKDQPELTSGLVDQMKAAQKAGMGLHYLRQISFSLADLDFHGPGESKMAREIMNRVLSETFLKPPEDTDFSAGFGHMAGYDSGYYGYAWADVMAADLFSLFPKGNILDSQMGMRLRREIFAPGSSRDEADSLRSFLGRDLDSRAFLEQIGVSP